MQRSGLSSFLLGNQENAEQVNDLVSKKYNTHNEGYILRKPGQKCLSSVVSCSFQTMHSINYGETWDFWQYGRCDVIQYGLYCLRVVYGVRGHDPTATLNSVVYIYHLCCISMTMCPNSYSIIMAAERLDNSQSSQRTCRLQWQTWSYTYLNIYMALTWHLHAWTIIGKRNRLHENCTLNWLLSAACMLIRDFEFMVHYYNNTKILM
jgi:hypothetical protein